LLATGIHRPHLFLGRRRTAKASAVRDLRGACDRHTILSTEFRHSRQRPSSTVMSASRPERRPPDQNKMG
jgi:hypothetical protein